MWMISPRIRAVVQIRKVGIISRHVLEHPSSPRGCVIHEIIMTKPRAIATVPRVKCNPTIVDCRIGNLLISVDLVAKIGIITENKVVRFRARAKMLRKPCIMRFLFLVLIL